MGTDVPLAVLSDRAAAAVQLLQATVRPGHEPADRPDPREDRDEHRVAARRRGEPARRDAGTRPPAAAQVADAHGRRPRPNPRADRPGLKAHTIRTLFARAAGEAGLAAAAGADLREAAEAVKGGASVLILSDRGVDAGNVPVPTLLADGRRSSPPDPGRPADARAAWWPRRARPARSTTSPCSSATGPGRSTRTWSSRRSAASRPTACSSTPNGNAIDPEQGGQELPQGDRRRLAEGLQQDGHQHADELPRGADLRGDRAEPGRRRSSSSPARRAASRASAWPRSPASRSPGTSSASRPTRATKSPDLDAGGEIMWRRRGEHHMWNPDTVQKLQHAVREESYATYKEFAEAANDEIRPALHAPRAARNQAGAASRSRSTWSSRPRRS